MFLRSPGHAVLVRTLAVSISMFLWVRTVVSQCSNVRHRRANLESAPFTAK